jgi:hypothetical protein
VQIALASNPDVVAVIRQAEAAGYDVGVARASRLPTLSAGARATYLNALEGAQTGFPSAGSGTSAGLTARIPIYQGGEPAARIRQAQALEGQMLEQVSGPSERWLPAPAPPLPLPGGASGDPVERAGRRPTSWRSKAPRRAFRSAPATSSTCSTPSRSY